MPISSDDLDRILEKRGSAIFRKAIAIVGQHYFPAYAKVMDELMLVSDELCKNRSGAEKSCSLLVDRTGGVETTSSKCKQVSQSGRI